MFEQVAVSAIEQVRLFLSAYDEGNITALEAITKIFVFLSHLEIK